MVSKVGEQNFNFTRVYGRNIYINEDYEPTYIWGGAPPCMIYYGI